MKRKRNDPDSAEFHKFYARILINQARVFRLRGHQHAADSLLQWAAKTRRTIPAVERDLFGDVA